ncbi:probable BOI-related E3 ubiquitin-protein ligase 2 [Typha latifolia]|uniref:probable BOI-related E3 ubiquitin-protein ligase 2 n=1 Tax=Typha latifolia TaxID=4733 RepID=UPI003C2EA1EE
MGKVTAELMERRRRLLRQMLAAIEQGAAKRLKAKEEEIEKMANLNWALQERIQSLCVENQIWRDLAQSSEATANSLRTNLEQVMDAQSNVGEQQRCEDSCHSREEKKVCKNCGGDEPSVLLLPCRHLCVCAACGPVVRLCPVCRFPHNGAVHVNLSH